MVATVSYEPRDTLGWNDCKMGLVEFIDHFLKQDVQLAVRCDFGDPRGIKIADRVPIYSAERGVIVLKLDRFPNDAKRLFPSFPGG